MSDLPIVPSTGPHLEADVVLEANKVYEVVVHGRAREFRYDRLVMYNTANGEPAGLMTLPETKAAN